MSKITKHHRGYDVEAFSDRAMGGWRQVYWSAFRRRDGYELTSGYGEYGTPREAVAGLCEVVDDMIDNYGGRVDRWEKRQ